MNLSMPAAAGVVRSAAVSLGGSHIGWDSTARRGAVVATGGSAILVAAGAARRRGCSPPTPDASHEPIPTSCLTSCGRSVATRSSASSGAVRAGASISPGGRTSTGWWRSRSSTRSARAIPRRRGGSCAPRARSRIRTSSRSTTSSSTTAPRSCRWSCWSAARCAGTPAGSRSPRSRACWRACSRASRTPRSTGSCTATSRRRA